MNLNQKELFPSEQLSTSQTQMKSGSRGSVVLLEFKGNYFKLLRTGQAVIGIGDTSRKIV